MTRFILLLVFLSRFLLFNSCDILKEEVNSENGGSPDFISLFSVNEEEGKSCYRIPSIVTAPNGDLIVAIDERVPSCRDLKWSKDINIVIRRSPDNGKTWLPVERAIDYEYGISASDPSMIVDRVTGDIFLFYNYMDLVNEKDVYYLHVVKSADNGISWSAPDDITDQISKPGWQGDFKFITSGRGTQTKDGKLLHCLVNLNHGMHIFGSDDHGTSWYLFDQNIEPANESKIIELDDGSWMINSRVNDSGRRAVHISKNHGQTWTSRFEKALIDPGCNASILNYHYNETRLLLFTNAANSDKRENLTIRYSSDSGETWSRGKQIYNGKSAYSSMTILKNGDVGLVFEKDSYQDNVFVRIPLSWILD